MILVTGGMAQGKRAFAQRTFAPGEAGTLLWADGGEADWEEFLKAPFCCGFHLLLERLFAGDPALRAPRKLYALRDRELAKAVCAALLEGCPDRILVTDEIGCGIVPMDPAQRYRREETGRICCLLAARSAQVWRVCCGLGQRIK